MSDILHYKRIFSSNSNSSGIIPYKTNALVGTTANITLSGTQTIDGVAVIVGDRVLVKDQSTQTENGIYIVSAGAWTRSTDADNGFELLNAIIKVTSGTVNTNKFFIDITPSPIIIGTTNVVFQEFTPGVYTGSNGITLSGSNFTNDLITGKLGGQTLYFDTNASGIGTISSTTNATKGIITIGGIIFDETLPSIKNSSTSVATGTISFSYGDHTTASGVHSTAFGYYTIANYDETFAQGILTLASGNAAIATGQATIASGDMSLSTGYITIAATRSSLSQGLSTRAGVKAFNADSIVNGLITINSSYGNVTTQFPFLGGDKIYVNDSAGDNNFGVKIVTIVSRSFNGTNTLVQTDVSDSSLDTNACLAVDINYNTYSTTVTGDVEVGKYSFAGGNATQALGESSFAFGNTSIVTGNSSIITGDNNILYGNRSAIIGGDSIVGVEDDTVYIPHLNIQSIDIDNSITNILVRDINGTIKLRSVNSIGGNGSDGNVTISGDLTLVRDIYYDTLTVDVGATLNTAGFRVFAKTEIINNGTISNIGTNASGATIGVGAATGTIGGGGNGGPATETGKGEGMGVNTTNSLGGNGGQCGGGPNEGIATQVLANVGGSQLFYIDNQLLSGRNLNSVIVEGGAGGGGCTVASVAAGGGGGGVVIAISPSITGTGLFSAKGGNGVAAAAASNESGSGGGGGGVIGIISNNDTALTSLTFNVNGGLGGAGDGSGSAGVNGVNGNIYKFII